MATEWNKLVQEKFRLGRLSNPAFSLKQAMKAAKKVYKKGKAVSAKVVKPFAKRSKKAKRSRKRQTRRRK